MRPHYKVELHLRSKLFDIQIIYDKNRLETMDVCTFLKKNDRKNHNMQRVTYTHTQSQQLNKTRIGQTYRKT